MWKINISDVAKALIWVAEMPTCWCNKLYVPSLVNGDRVDGSLFDGGLVTIGYKEPFLFYFT